MLIWQATVKFDTRLLLSVTGALGVVLTALRQTLEVVETQFVESSLLEIEFRRW